MTKQAIPRSMTRRELLAAGATCGATALVAGPGFIASTSEAWAAEAAHLTPGTMASLVQMARDIYPHDRLADRFYAIVAKSHDTAEAAPGV